MFTQNDLIDALRRHMSPEGGYPAEQAPKPASTPPRAQMLNSAPTLIEKDEYNDPGCLKPLCGRRFLTEYEIKEALTPNMKRLTIPKDAIVSPLAEDWLVLKGIRIVRSS